MQVTLNVLLWLGFLFQNVGRKGVCWRIFLNNSDLNFIKFQIKYSNRFFGKKGTQKILQIREK